MKLSVSNIAWGKPFEQEVLDILRDRGIEGIEIAPTKIWPDWQNINSAEVERVRKYLNSQSFSITALQAVLFRKPELNIFGTAENQERIYTHLCMVADLAAGLGAHLVVFGSPKNRDPGSLFPDEAFEIAIRFFRLVGDYYALKDVALCIEANPIQYGCRFLTNSNEAARLVRAVDSPGIALHLDSACMTLAGEDPVASIQEHFPLIRHFHVSEPNLGDFSDPQVDHSTIASALRQCNYCGWISIEMRAPQDPLTGLAQAVDFTRSTYLLETLS